MKILIVDDSETVRMQLKKDLEAEKYTVIEARNGAEGIEVLNKNPDVKLIISDVNMPVMDGLEMTKQIQRTQKFKGLPVFILSTESTPDMKAKGRSVGVTAWISKPYVTEKLLASVGKIAK